MLLARLETSRLRRTGYLYQGVEFCVSLTRPTRRRVDTGERRGATVRDETDGGHSKPGSCPLRFHLRGGAQLPWSDRRNGDFQQTVFAVQRGTDAIARTLARPFYERSGGGKINNAEGERESTKNIVCKYIYIYI